MTKTIKIILGIVAIIIVLWIGFRLYNDYLGGSADKEKIVQLEKDNLLKDEQIKSKLAEQDILKQQVVDSQIEKDSLQNNIAKLNTGLKNLKGLQAANKQVYEDKIKDTPNDSTDAVTRCTRACTEAATLGDEFKCPRDFCTQFSNTAK